MILEERLLLRWELFSFQPMTLFKYLHGTLNVDYPVGLHSFRLRIVYDRRTHTLVDADINYKTGWRILTGTEFTAAQAFVAGLNLERNYSELGLTTSIFKPAWVVED